MPIRASGAKTPVAPIMPITRAKKGKGMSKRFAGAAALALIVSSSGCAATQAWAVAHPDQAHLLGLIAQGVGCADPLIAQAIGGTPIEDLLVGIATCTTNLIAAGKLLPTEEEVVVSAALNKLEVVRAKAIRDKSCPVLPPMAPLFPDPKPAT